jgi:hypothetical protein
MGFSLVCFAGAGSDAAARVFLRIRADVSADVSIARPFLCH